MFVPYFSLQENYGSPGQKDHEVPIDVKAMSEYGSFKFRSELRIEGAFQSSLTRLSIRLQEQHYHYRSSYTAAQTQRMEPFLSISGFPRKLWAQNICPTPVDNEPGSDLEADATAKSERLEGKVETPLETPDEEGPRSPGESRSCCGWVKRRGVVLIRKFCVEPGPPSRTPGRLARTQADCRLVERGW